jgi:hypothetical protein
LPARRQANARANPARPSQNDDLFLIQYQDGLNAAVAMLDSVGECFAFAGQRKGGDAPDVAVFDLENRHPFGHFGYLARAIEHMVTTGQPFYPVERTLLTTGMLSALLQSRSEGGPTIKTPHLAAVRYQAVDYPHAAGPTGTPA